MPNADHPPTGTEQYAQGAEVRIPGVAGSSSERQRLGPKGFQEHSCDQARERWPVKQQ